MSAVVTLWQVWGSFLDVQRGALSTRRGSACWRWSYFGKKRLDHQVHAADIEVHREVPVLLFAVQDGSVVDKPGAVSKQRGNDHLKRF